MKKYFDAIHITENTQIKIPQKPKQSFFSPRFEGTFKYFYKSLQVVLSIWIFTVLVITTQPWVDYWMKSQINGQTSPKTLGETIVATPTPTSQVKYALPSFYLKNGNVEIQAPIVEGIDETALKQGIGHHKNSVWPNQKGNMVLAGHNTDLDANNPYGKIFFRLRDVNVGDEVKIGFRGKVYYYKIFKKDTVSPDDTSLFGQIDDWILTFYTCDPPYTDWKRLVLQAKLIKIE